MEIYSENDSSVPVDDAEIPDVSLRSSPISIKNLALDGLSTGVYTIKIALEKNSGSSIMQEVTVIMVLEE